MQNMSQQISLIWLSSFFWKRHFFRVKLGLDFWQGKQQTFGDTEVESTIIVEKSASG